MAVSVFSGYFGHHTLKNAHSNVSSLIFYVIPSRFISLNLISQDGDTAFLLAARGGHYKLCEFLVQEGADIQGKNNVSA